MNVLKSSKPNVSKEVPFNPGRRSFLGTLGWGAAAVSALPVAMKLLESPALAQGKAVKPFFVLDGANLTVKEMQDGKEVTLGVTQLPAGQLMALTKKPEVRQIEPSDLKGAQEIKNIAVLFFEFGIMAIKETTMDVLIEHAVSSKKLDAAKLKVEENGTVLYEGKAMWKIATSGQLRITPAGA